MSAPATSAVDMSHPVEDATPGTEATTSNGTSSSSPSSTSPPPSAQHPPADSEPVSTTATPMAQPDPNEVPPRVVSDLPTRPVSVPPGPVANGHVAAVASSASPSLPTQPRPTTAPVNRPPPAGPGQPLPPAFDEKLPLFGVLKTRIIHPPAPQPPIPQPGSHPTLMVQPQHPQAQSHQQPQPQSHQQPQPQSHQQPHPYPHQQAQSYQHQHPHPHSHPHPHHPQQALPPPPPVVPSSASPPVANAKHVTNAAAFNDEYAQLSALFRRSSPGVVRRVVRDNWEKCLLGTEFHTTFITNVAVHHASGGILQRALGDFGGRLVQEGTTQIANLLTQKHLDDVFTILLPKMSDRFLDAAVSYRLPSIPAQRLLNHLARAERLGYDANDIEEEADEPEPLIPATMSTPRPPANPPPPPVHQHAQAPTYTQPTQQGSPALPPPKAAPAPPPRPSQHQVGQNGQAPTDGADTPFTCSSCHKTFIHEAAFRYHHRKAVCKRDLLGPLLSQCPFCYKGFASDGGLSYHLLNNVCGVSGGTPNDSARIKRTVVDASKASSSASSPALMTPQSTAQAPRQTPVPVPVMGSRGIPGPVAAMSSSPAGPPPIQSDLLPGFHQHYAPAPATPTPPTPNDQALRAGAHLEPAQRAAMEAEMRRAEDNLKNKIDEAKRSWDPADLERRLSSLRNSHATKQSQIRKKYGIRLRTRRGPSAMIEERLRVGLPADLPAKKHSTPGMADGTTPPPNGSQALNTNGKRPLYSEGGIQPSSSPSHPPVKKLAVSELTGGLGGTSATAAMQDPTAMSSQDNPGYYTSTPMNPSQSHFAGHPSALGSSQRVQATPQRIQMGVAGRGISREEPVDVESSSDSGSDIEAD